MPLTIGFRLMETTIEPQTSITSPKGHTLSLKTTQKSNFKCVSLYSVVKSSYLLFEIYNLRKPLEKIENKRFEFILTMNDWKGRNKTSNFKFTFKFHFN